MRLCAVVVPLCRGAEQDVAGHAPRLPHLAHHAPALEQVSTQACSPHHTQAGSHSVSVTGGKYTAVCTSVGDPNPDVFGPPGYGCQRYGRIRIRLRTRILPFSHKGVERTEIMLAK
jgi:hypothetical protein